MADTITPMTAEALVNAEGLTNAAKDYYNVQLNIQKAIAANNTQTLGMLGLNKELSINIVEVLKRVEEGSDKIKLVDEEIRQLTESLKTASGEQLKDMNNMLKSALQRKAEYAAEVDLLSNMMKKGWIPIMFAIGQVWKLFKSMDKAAFDFRMKMGAVRGAVEDTRKMAQKLAIDFMDVGVTIDGVYNSIVALGEEMGSIRLVTAELAKTTALMNAQLGISEKDSAGFMRNMAAVSGTTMETQRNMVYTAAAMTQAYGIPLNLVMGDIAKMSGTTLTMVSKYPSQILRAAIEARRLNTTLELVAKGGADILNFTDSVNAEMEASVLLGKSINMQKARELAYTGDMVGLNEEVLRLAKDLNFTQQDRFQKEATAKALGRSVEDLTKMVQASEEWESALRSTNPEIQKQVKAIQAMEQASKATINDETEKMRIMVETKSNQMRMVAIQQKWNKLLAQASEAFLPFVDLILSVVPAMIPFIPLFGVLVSIVGALGSATTKLRELQGIAGTIAVGATGLVKWVQNIEKVSKYFKPVFNLMAWVSKTVLGIGGKIAAWVPPLARFVAPWLKLLGPIGWIITAFQAISGLIRGWQSGVGFWDKLGKAIMGALAGVIPGFSYVQKALGWIWDKSKGMLGVIWSIAKFLFLWTTPMGIVMNLTTLLIKKFGGVNSVIGWIWKSIKDVASIAWSIVEFALNWLNPIGMIYNLFKLILGNTTDIWSKIGGIVKFALNWLNPIGIIYNLFKLIGKFISDWLRPMNVTVGIWETLKGYVSSYIKNIIDLGTIIFDYVIKPYKLAWEGIKFLWDNVGPYMWEGIKSIGSFILDAAMWPYKMAWKAIKFFFSPSEIGAALVAGVTSVGIAMFDAITWPWRKALSWMLSMIPFMGDTAKKVAGGLNEMVGTPAETGATNSYVSPTTITPTGTKVAGQNTTNAKPGESTKEAIKYTMDDIYEQMKQMNDNLANGKIRTGGLYVNGSLLSSILARELEFSGQFGTNK